MRRFSRAHVDMGFFEEGQVKEGPDPYHKKFVQIAGEDGGKFQPLQQGDALVPRLLQHPLVEAEPGQLPVLGVTGIHVFVHKAALLPKIPAFL